MRGLGGAALILLAWGQAEGVRASAWSLPKGEGQTIIKYESLSAGEFFDRNGETVDLLGGRRDSVASILTEYGLTHRLTIQAKGEWQSGRDGRQGFEGRGPIEIGARWQVHQGDRTVVSVYGAYSQSGETRNAGYARPGQGEQDVELRLLTGYGGEGLFTEAQLARRFRDGLPDETRLDLTVGQHMSPLWMVLGQVYSGVTDTTETGQRTIWAVGEVSAVRHYGPWSGQLGWRTTLAGQSTPLTHGAVVAIWRRF